MFKRVKLAAAFLVVAVAGCECGEPVPALQFTVGGAVEGLAGSGLVLQNNGQDDLAVTADGPFAFPTSIDQGSAYAVTILQQPSEPKQTCELSEAEGTVDAAAVTTVAVRCTTNTYALGGTVTGLLGAGLVLQNDLGDELAIAENGAFSFPTALRSAQTFTVTVRTQPSAPTQTCVVSGGSGTVVDGDVTSVTVNCATDTFTIGGTVSGLAGSGLVLENNGEEALPLSSNGTFAFPTPVSSGAAFSVAVKTQPSAPTQTCSVAMGTGTVGGGNVTTVAVVCATNTYPVGGTVSGLSGSGLVLQNNLGDNLMISGDGAFTFPAQIASGAAYSVTVSLQPTSPWQTCAVTAGSGTVTNAAVGSVQIACALNTYAVGGTVTGLLGGGLTLQNNAGDDLLVAADGTFAFDQKVASGDDFEVTILTQPSNPWQTCAVAGGTGTVGGADVSSITVNCVTNAYTVGGTVSGLAGTGLSVKLNGGAAVMLSANGTWAFPTTLESNSAYEVTFDTQPASPWQTCTLANATGTVTSAAVTDVAITCVTNTYNVGGTVSGLSGSGLKLLNNGGDELAVNANGSFLFSAPAQSGQGYAVTLSAQPTSPWQTCTVSSGAGSVTNDHVTTVQVTCVTNTYTVGGTVSGLEGILTLHNNGANALVLNANGTFTFSTALASGSAYAVTVAGQPTSPSQTCTVAQGSGSLTDADVTSVQVSCVTNSFEVGGTVSGLSGSGLVLTNNGGDALPVSADGTFIFPVKVASGQPFAVAVQSDPASPYQTCTVSGGAGTVGGADVTSVLVNCTTNTYAVGGTVSGLLGPGLVLTNDGESLPVGADGAFAFPTPVPSGAGYAVTISASPTSPAQTCVVTGANGTVSNQEVTSVAVACTRNHYDLRVDVSGLSGTGLVLQNNASDSLTVPSNGVLTFSTQVGSGLPYEVLPLSQPTSPWQTCTVASPSGTMGSAAVTLTVTCATNEYSVGGTVSGAVGSGLQLRLNGSDTLPVASNGAFTFPSPLASGSSYEVTVLANPGAQICSVDQGSGTIAGANVTSVEVICTTLRPNFLQCGHSERDVNTFVPSGVSLTKVVSCTPDANTQAILITRFGASTVNAAALQSYVNGGGVVLTEFNISATVFNMLFGTNVTSGSFAGFCYDTAPTLVQFTPADPFWQDNPFQVNNGSEVGCGTSISHFPGLTPIAGWSATEVAIGYRDLGLGRVWAADFDWQDTDLQGPGMNYTNSLMGYMITRRR